MSDLLRRPGPPDPVRDADPPRADDRRFQDVVAPDARLVSLYDQATFSEGPAWWPARDLLAWSDVVGRRVLGWHPDGCVRVVVDATPFINGHAVDRDGALVHCEHGTRRLGRTLGDGRYEVVVDRFDGRRFNSPNDVTCGPDDALWFTDPRFGLHMPKQGALAEPEIGHQSVYRVDADKRVATRMADLEEPNGLAFSPDGRTFYVSDTSRALAGDRHEIVAFDVGPDFSLSGRRTFATVDPGIPDGFRVDRRGWLWTSSGSGIQVFAPDGHRLGLIPTPQVASNCCFGPGERRLFITSVQHLYAIDLAGD